VDGKIIKQGGCGIDIVFIKGAGVGSSGDVCENL